MLVALSLLKVRDGHMEKLMSMLKENTISAQGQKGNIGNYIARGTDDEDDVLLLSLWDNESDYEAAKKTLKKQYRKDLFSFLSHMAKQPKIQIFETV